jgi:hypothetical protein
MAAETRYGSIGVTNFANTTPPTMAPPGVAGGVVRVSVETDELASTDSASTTVLLARVPSSARILGLSTIKWDQLSSIAATALIGVYNVGSTTLITDAPSAFTTTALATSVSGSQSAITDIANYGKRLYEYASASTDPKCDLDIKLKTVSDNTVAGTVTLEL